MPFDPMNPYAQIMGNTMDPLQVQPPAQPLQAPAQPQQPGFLDKLGGFLSHPAVQGLLGAYFGAVSSPRHGGFGAAIGRGGLMGLGMAGEATALQQREQALRNEAAQRAATFGLDQQKVGLARQTKDIEERRLSAEQADKPKQIGLKYAAGALQTNPELAKRWDVGTLALLTPMQLRQEIDNATKMAGQDPVSQSVIARNTAEAARARRDPADATPKAKLAEIYGPGGATREESVGAGYTPPPGWSLKAPGKPTAPPKAVDPALRENRIAAVNDHWTKNAPYFAGVRAPEYQEAHYQALISAGATPEEASQLMHGYVSTAPAGMPATSVQPAGGSQPAESAGGPGTAGAAETPPSRPAHAPPNYVHGRHANGTPGWAAPGTPDFTPDGA